MLRPVAFREPWRCAVAGVAVLFIAAGAIAAVAGRASVPALAAHAAVALTALAFVALRSDAVLAAAEQETDQRARLALQQEEQAREELGRSNELLLALSRSLAEYITSPDNDRVFDGLLDDLLLLTDSHYGFVGEVMRSSGGIPYVEYRAIRNISWLAAGDAGQPHLTYADLDPLVDQVLQSERVLLRAATEGEGATPGPSGTFAGIPLVMGPDMVGVIGLGGRSVGYAQELLDYLQPAMASCTTLLLSAKAQAERESTAKQLRESEERYRDLFEHASDLIHSVRPDGSFAYVNRAWLDTLGYTEQEVEHLTIWQVTGPEVHAGYRALLASPDETVATPLSEVSFFTKDGRTIQCEGTETCRVVDGVSVATRGMFRDVSAQRRAAEAMRQARDEAEAAARTKSDFLANMSHEIRTPMNAVIGMTGLLLDTPLSDEQRDFVETIRNAGDGLLEIINDILDFSKIDSGRLALERHPFNPHECVEAAADLIAPTAAAKGLELVLSIDPAVPPRLIGDVTRLRQILVNLLGNAVKFTAAGQIEVRIEGTALEDGNWRMLARVVDSGIGIPADRLHRLFQAFSQVDTSTTRQYGGTGLGLAISKRLAELMGGEMWVESTVGVGSSFNFTFVVGAAAAEPATTAEGSTLVGRRVLVVDDNAAQRASLGRQLGAWGIVADVADGVEAALAALAAARPDLVLLDQHLPETDGVSPVARVRDAAGPATPIVVLTGLGQAGARARTTESVAAAVSKPVKIGALREALTSALGGTTTAPAATTRSKWALDEHMAARLPLRILVAEDNVVNQKVVVKMLGRLGYRVEVVNNGLEAVEAVGRQRYDVLLLDVQMPIMDGFEAARCLRTAKPPAHRPRIVGMTALAMTGDRERCLEAGMDDYISKPVRPEELQRALERAAVTPPIDEEVIANLRELQDPDEPDFVAELIDVLLGDAPARFEALREAIATANATAVNRTAHSLKSSCGNLGARTLAGLLAELEKKGLEQDMVGAAALLAQVTGEFERVRGALLELRGASSEAA